MTRRVRVIAGAAAAVMLALGAVPIAHAADRLLPHAVDLWDTTQCSPATSADHSVFGMAALVLQPGHPDVQILEARPLGLSAGARWRTWVVPVAEDAGWTGSLGTSAPPVGWSQRVAAAGATLSGDRRAELDLEIWPGPGETRTAVRGFLVRYRTVFGITRTARTPTELTTRAGGCS